MITYFFDNQEGRFRIVGPSVNLLIPHGADPEGFVGMVRANVQDATGVLLPVMSF